MNSIIKVVKTTGQYPDFIALIKIFDIFLWERYPELKKEYWRKSINTLQLIDANYQI